ncbi:pilus assembly protein PapC [Roseateles chitinivorans]|uniref:Pilus assembly protein PapC n=1 Tax=Roseateles chitinivorans TaxID=2917965 RepID=A0A2G9CD29_9BURK|nr:TcfC E-set like domain-containing protein [Roseateles chitinivorans]PIM53409.1 pilus assembly protein PapC [Roseateles chitinivorans]
MTYSKGRVLPLAFAVTLAWAAAGTVRAQDELSLAAQAKLLPEEFKEHFFDVPLAMRVEVDGKPLSDAMGVLTAEGRVQLIEWIKDAGGTSAEDQTRWLHFLKEPRSLGNCERECEGVVAVAYSLQTSTLSILTARAERVATDDRYHQLPDGGSHGLMLHNSLNVAGGKDQPFSGRYSVDAIGSAGQWTGVGTFLASRRGAAPGARQQVLSRLYFQREMEGAFIRGGLFVPDFQGRVRAPRAPDGLPDATLGVMVGTSDALEVAQAMPSMAPLHVTASRQGVVELLRDGLLIYTQPVDAGLQAINTRTLPTGIYEVEVRLIEDGKLASTRKDLIYKPTAWADTARPWRYALFAGQERELAGGHAGAARALTAGGAVNYLVHPRLVVGGALQQAGARRSVAASLDWTAADVVQLYLGASHSTERGAGIDVQAMYRYDGGTLTGSHNASRLRLHQGWPATVSHRRQANSSLTWTHQWASSTRLTGHLARAEGVSPGTGIDLGLTHQRKLFGTEAHITVSLFDRPMSHWIGRRDRGVTLTLSMSLGEGSRGYSMSTGVRSDALGRRDVHASVGVRQSLSGSYLTHVSGSASFDRHGVGLSGAAAVQHDLVEGDIFLQRSSMNRGWSGGANLSSSLAVAAGGVAMSGQPQAASADTGVIIDVDSDMPEAALWAQDNQGIGVPLHPGRNFVPVTAYRSGNLQLDFDAVSAPSAAVQPALLAYHLNKGGVGFRTVRVMRTMTVIGRLIDQDGQPAKGGRVDNHAGQAVTEVDGMFSLEVSERDPVLRIRHASAGECRVMLGQSLARRDGDALLLGDVSCPTDPNAHVSATPGRQGG